MQPRYDFSLDLASSCSISAAAEFDKYSACRTLPRDSVNMLKPRNGTRSTTHGMFLCDLHNCRAVEMRNGR